MKRDATEAAVNAIIGFAISWAATVWLLPLWGLHPSPGAGFAITALFFSLSFTRAFLLRRVFRRLA